MTTHCPPLLAPWLQYPWLSAYEDEFFALYRASSSPNHLFAGPEYNLYAEKLTQASRTVNDKQCSHKADPEVSNKFTSLRYIAAIIKCKHARVNVKRGHQIISETMKPSAAKLNPSYSVTLPLSKRLARNHHAGFAQARLLCPNNLPERVC